MKRLAYSLALALLAAPLATAKDASSLDPAVSAVVQRRWPTPFGQIRGRLTQSNQAAVFAALRAAGAFVSSGSAEVSGAAARDFKAALDTMGPDLSRLIEKGGGLGEIARDVLGPEEFLDLIERTSSNAPKSEGVLVTQAETFYSAGRFREAAETARHAWELSGRKNPDALALLRSSEGRGAPQSAPLGVEPQEGERKFASVIAQPAGEKQVVAMSKIEKRRAIAIPEVDHLNILDDETAAPEPSAVDRVLALVTPTKSIVADDLKTLRRQVAKFEIPAETVSIGSENLDAPRSFVSWIKTMSDSDLPDISYGTLPGGQLASYQPGLLSKGKIVMNFYIRGAEPAARSTVLLHELYHYWDFEVAKNPYPNVSYGHHSPAGVARREYDPYYLTALYWAHVNPGDASSPLARSLTALPSNAEDLQRRVDALVSRRKDEK